MTLDESRAHYKNMHHLSDTISYTSSSEKTFYFSYFGGELSHAENSNSEWVGSTQGSCQVYDIFSSKKIHVTWKERDS